jgi:hypothetical protein
VGETSKRLRTEGRLWDCTKEEKNIKEPLKMTAPFFIECFN